LFTYDEKEKENGREELARQYERNRNNDESAANVPLNWSDSGDSQRRAGGNDTGLRENSARERNRNGQVTKVA
jgi:hypothetical protein